ncbi:MAG: ABC transporter permease [Candidatus Heimdallarchaeota archaeon]
MEMEAIMDFLSLTIMAGTPLLLGTLGEIYAERAGILNLGIEGMMIMGAITGFSVTHLTGSALFGVLLAMLVGGLLSLIHAFVSISLRGNQVVSGLALTMFGLGLSGLIGRNYIGIPGKSLKTKPIPGLERIPFLGRIIFQQDILIYLSLILVPVLWFLLFRTKVGIVIRSVGEDPSAADAIGINVHRVRYFCVVFGGAMAGLGGAYLSLRLAPAWIEGMTAGRGWIVVALTIFAMWNPSRALIGAYLFGGVEVLQFRLQPFGIPPSFLGMLPYLATIIVLLIGSKETLKKKMGAPTALGFPYSREEA